MATRIYMVEGCVLMCVSVFTNVGLVDRGCLCLSVKLSVLISILFVYRHIYITLSPSITCLHIRTHKNKAPLNVDFYTFNITLST